MTNVSDRRTLGSMLIDKNGLCISATGVANDSETGSLHALYHRKCSEGENLLVEGEEFDILLQKGDSELDVLAATFLERK
mmetsp:Transcript_8146/g.9315  ORF Transcript_8146/g.9315 Transcript_8146/m.9315 type:complete len:80 (+) Transcript_8146:167-406(+)